MTVFTFVAVGGLLLLSGCSDDAAKKKLEAARATATSLADQVETLTSNAESLQSDLDEQTGAAAQAVADSQTAKDAAAAAETGRQKAEDAQVAAESERDAAIARADQAEADKAAVIQSFDPQIQAALAGVQAKALVEACRVATESGTSGSTVKPGIEKALNDLVKDIPPAVLGDRTVLDLVDQPAVQAEIERCYGVGHQQFVDGQAAEQAAAAAAALAAPRGDGIYTIGLEMASGKWRSDGTADDCYWQVSPDGNPDDIISNHFGNAGGSVTVRNGQEFQTRGCGTWSLAL